MTVTPAAIYWITRLDIISNASTFLAILLPIAIIAIYCNIDWNAFHNKEHGAHRDAVLANRTLKWLTGSFIISALLTIFVPTTKEATAAYVIPAIIESPTVKEKLPEMYDLGMKALTEWLATNNNEKK